MANLETSVSAGPEASLETLPAAPGAGLARGLFGLGLLIYSVFCGVFLSHSSRWFLGYVGDDAFYYLQTARHIAATGVSTFDGINPTNGYHPGWMLLMVICAKLFPNRDLLLKVSLAMEFLCHVGTCVVMVLIMRRLVSEFWAWIIGAAWLLNPLPFVFGTNGVEATLVQLALAVAVLAYVVHIAPFVGIGRDFVPPVRSLVWFGASLGLAFYARTDQAFLAVIAVLGLLAMTLLWTRPARRLSACGRIILGIGGTFVVCIVPWYLYSYLSTGSLSQDSGVMKMLWHHQTHLHLGLLGNIRFVSGFLLYSWFGAHIDYFGATIGLRKVVILASTAIIIWSWIVIRRSPLVDQWKGITLWLMLFGLCTGIIYALLLADLQFWHLSASAFISFFLMAGWTALALQQMRPRVQKVVGVSILGAMLLFGGWYHATAKAGPVWQQAVYDSQPRFEKMVPPDARIGCFNAGIPAYFSDRTIVNLDGLVNHAIYPYWKKHQFYQYLIDQHIAYIFDEEEALGRAQRYSSVPITVIPITRCLLPRWHTPYRYLWKVVNTGNH